MAPCPRRSHHPRGSPARDQGPVDGRRLRRSHPAGGRRKLTMPTFLYKALQGDGTMAEGQLEAGGRQDAFRQIEGRGWRAVRVAEKSQGPGRKTENGGMKPAK